MSQTQNTAAMHQHQTYTLLTHTKNNASNTQNYFKCSFCKKVFVLQVDLLYHLQQIHKCKFNNNNNHTLQQQQQQSLQCSYNNTSNITNTANLFLPTLSLTFSSSSSSSSYVSCNICQQQFKNTYQLNYHFLMNHLL